MAKGQKRSNKEVKKQKQSKTITVLAPNTVGLPKPRKLSDTYIHTAEKINAVDIY